MRRTTQERNKALVLEAFNTLFIKRDYATASGICRPTTSSTALTFRQAAKDCSIWSNASTDVEVRAGDDCG